ncbi:MAG: flavin reductase family protein [Caldilineaceae bacterium]
MSDQATQFDTRAFRNACGKFATGITVVTTVVDGETHGMTANAFMSVSLEPPLVAVSVAKKAHMHDHIAHSGRYAVSILRADQESHSSHFAGWAVDGFEAQFDERHEHPTIAQAIATFVTTVVDAHDAGDHTIYIGRVDYFESSDEDPVLFYAGKYRQISPLS